MAFLKWFYFFVMMGLLGVGLCTRADDSVPKPTRLAKHSKHATSDKGEVVLPPLLREVEAKYESLPTIQADFDQVKETASLGMKKKSHGTMMIKRPNKIRWQTETPEKSLFVSDGHKFWVYTPPFDEGEAGQVIESKSSQIPELAKALLSGTFSKAKSMRVQPDGEKGFFLIPNRGTAGDLKRAILEIDAEKKFIQRVTLEYDSGNRTEIALSKIELGSQLGDELFDFHPPPNTERIQQ